MNSALLCHSLLGTLSRCLFSQPKVVPAREAGGNLDPSEADTKHQVELQEVKASLEEAQQGKAEAEDKAGELAGEVDDLKASLEEVQQISIFDIPQPTQLVQPDLSKYNQVSQQVSATIPRQLLNWVYYPLELELPPLLLSSLLLLLLLSPPLLLLPLYLLLPHSICFEFSSRQAHIRGRYMGEYWRLSSMGHQIDPKVAAQVSENYH